MNYDPNIHNAIQLVLLTYGLFEHRLQAVVEVQGNYRGLEVIEWALELHYEQLDTAAGDGLAHMELVSPAGEVLLVEDATLAQADWLQDMLIAGEILSIAPGGKGRAPATPFTGLGGRAQTTAEKAIAGDSRTARMRFALAELGPCTARQLAQLVGLPSTALVGALLKHDMGKGAVLFHDGKYHAAQAAAEATS